MSSMSDTVLCPYMNNSFRSTTAFVRQRLPFLSFTSAEPEISDLPEEVTGCDARSV